MILYAILGLLLIGMIVLAVLSRKDWHWLNLVLLIFVFIAGSAAMISMAQTLFLRRNAYIAWDRAVTAAKKADDALEIAIFGDVDSAEYSSDSLRGVSQELNLLQIGRGRTISNGKVSNNNGQIRFEFPEEQPAAQDENSLLQRDLFAFAEADVNGGLAPVTFVGKFRVTEQQPGFLTLDRTDLVADAEQYARPTSSWTLFERMPFDVHGIFRDAEGITAQKEEDFDISAFRQKLTSKYLPAAMFGLEPDSAAYEAIIDRYAFDGLSIGKIKRWIDANQATRKEPFDPPIDEKFVLFRFEGKSKETYAVDDESGNLEDDGAFTPNGLAVDRKLHLGRDVDFKKDDLVLIDQRTALEGYDNPDGTRIQPFNTRENVENLGVYFSRKLTDYPFELGNIVNRTRRTSDSTSRISANNEVQQATNQNMEAQRLERVRQLGAVDDDNKFLQEDVDLIEALAATREEENRLNARRIDELLDEIDRLKQRVVELEASSVYAR